VHIQRVIVVTVAAGLALIVSAACRSSPPPAKQEATVAAAAPAYDCPTGHTTNPDPFASNYGKAPGNGYPGPFFKLSHRYPAAKPAPPVDTPWRNALKGQSISSQTALDYVRELKKFVATDMRQLLLQYDQWDASARGWYNEPWIGNERESIHGMYIGTAFPPGTFRDLKVGMTTWVVTYYGKAAGYTVGQVWADPQQPDLKNAQYQEGAVIVKIAATTASPDQWAPMAGTAAWQIFGCPVDTTATFNQGTPTGPPALTTVRIFQVDIIVKDSVTAPATGWVFTTLVHDNSVVGDAWDKLVPLGAMWGNDPGVGDGSALQETVVNPAAPAYSTETLGWGGRLSGPNDGAVVEPASFDGQTQVAKAPASSCMSCHGPAEWPRPAFLLPSPSPEGHPGEPTMVGPQGPSDPMIMKLYPPGSPDWDQWFQDRAGTVPQNAGSVALDYDMVLAFKSLPAWDKYKHPKPLGAPRRARPRLYHGR
jgi:hypothetical protein